jgi:hypothetical protein
MAAKKRKTKVARTAAQTEKAHSGEPVQRGAEIDDFVAKIEPLARSIVELQSQARALGIFPNDRDLLICPTCGLTEDVAGDGRLVTSRELGGTDTGLRFVEPTSDDEPFICPACGGEVRSHHAHDVEV